MTTSDIIIVGAGSVGTPLAMFLAEKKLKVMVIDELPSSGQGQNKAAIGGIRATHSDGSKIQVGLESIKIFSNWEKMSGEDIGWKQGGYLFPVYEEKDEAMLKEMLKIQHSFGLDINWIEPEEIAKLADGIRKNGLRGGTFSPGDGSASPLLSNNSFFNKAKKNGVRFVFNEKVVSIIKNGNVIEGVKTNKSEYRSKYTVNSAGASARDISLMVGVDIPVRPDSHEAGILEPAKTGIKPMIVDIRPSVKSKNYYFYSNSADQIIFCLTPSPSVWGTNRESTSEFLTEIAGRMINLMPKLSNIMVRRTWRGLYPMTPDGFPIVDFPKKGYIVAAGMCGQGFMLGPGLGEILSEILVSNDKKALEKISNFKLDRKFATQEKLK